MGRLNETLIHLNKAANWAIKQDHYALRTIWSLPEGRTDGTRIEGSSILPDRCLMKIRDFAGSQISDGMVDWAFNPWM